MLLSPGCAAIAIARMRDKTGILGKIGQGKRFNITPSHYLGNDDPHTSPKRK
jgi:hypothetical protein